MPARINLDEPDNLTPRLNLEDDADINPTWEGIKGAAKGVLAAVPFMPVQSPVQEAPAPNSLFAGTEQFVRPVSRAIGATAIGSIGGAPGVAAANMADKAIQIGTEQGVEGFTERPIATGIDIALAGATSSLPFKFGSSSTAAAREAIEAGAKKLPIFLGLAGKNAAVDTAAGVAQTAADAGQRGQNIFDAAADSFLPNLGMAVGAGLLGARGAVKGKPAPELPIQPKPAESPVSPRINLDDETPVVADKATQEQLQGVLDGTAKPSGRTLYHGPGHEKNGQRILESGFDLGRVGENNMRTLDGVYFTDDPQIAGNYTEFDPPIHGWHDENGGRGAVPESRYNAFVQTDMSPNAKVYDATSEIRALYEKYPDYGLDALKDKGLGDKDISNYDSRLAEFKALSDKIRADGYDVAHSKIGGAGEETSDYIILRPEAFKYRHGGPKPKMPTAPAIEPIAGGTGKVPPSGDGGAIPPIPPKPPVSEGASNRGPVGDGPQKYVGSQNVSKMPVTQEEYLTLKQAYNKEADEINRMKGDKRVSEAVIEDATKSKVMDWTAKQATEAYINPSKFDMTDADQFALRSRAMGNLRKYTQSGDKESYNEFVSFMKAAQRMAAKAGQELQSYRIQAKAWDSVLTTKDKTAVRMMDIFKEDVGGIPEQFKQKLSNLKPDDYTGANKLIQEAAATKHGKYWWVHPYIYFNLLSNPVTHLGNASANLAQTVGGVAVKGVAGALNMGKSVANREVDIAELPAYVKGIGKGVSAGAARAMYAWKNGFTQNQAKELKGAIFPQFTGMKSILNTPGRALQAADEFFRSVNASAEADALAMRQARKDVAAKGGDVKKIAEAYLASPTKEMIEKIDMASARSVFQEELPKQITKLQEFINSLEVGGGDIKPMKFIQPFIQVPFNVTKQILENSPAGVLMKNTGLNKSERIARAVIGTAPLLVLMPMIEDGTIEVVGPIPKDSKERERFFSENKRPWSVKVGGRYVDLKFFGAFSAPLAIAGAYGQALKTKGKKPDSSVAEQMVYNTTNFMADASFFTGFSSFAGMIDDPETRGPRFLANMGSQWVPGGGAQRFINQLPAPIGDKWQREAETAWEKIVGGTIAARHTLPIRYSGVGEKVERNGPFPLAKKDALLAEFEKHKIGMGQPSRKQTTRDGEEVELDKDQLRALIEGVNAPVATKARELIASERYRNANPVQQKIMLEVVLKKRDPLFNQTRRKQGLDFLRPR
jgi:hypothetical protein